MVNKLHIKSLRKNIFTFLKSSRIKLIIIIKPRIHFAFSFIVIRLPLFSIKRKIKICSIKYLNFLNDKDIKKLKLGSDKGQLALKILNTFSELDFELIEKICWLISYSRYKHFQVAILFKHLDQFKLGEKEIKKLLILMLPPFTHFGDYTRFEEVLIYLRIKLDKKINRNIGIYKESSFFTAIGHMSELTYLMKAVELKLINLSDTEVNLAISNTPISNLEYSNLIIEKCKKIGLNIKYYDCSYLDLEPCMELYPVSSIGKYIFGRHVMGLINCYWDIYNGQNYLTLKNSQKKIAEDVFKKNFGFIPSNFVGMHIRLTKDTKGLRNPNIKTAKNCIKEISKLGVKTVLIGMQTNLLSKLNSSDCDINFSDNVLDTTRISISRYERECLQLYVWSNSRFFVGSLSGGTNPAGIFGTPTIWIDCHAEIHWRSPFKNDHMIMKRIFYARENRFLKFNEFFEEKHIASQSENATFVKYNGYEIIGCEQEILGRSIQAMNDQTNKGRNRVNWEKSEKEKCLKSMKSLIEEGKFKPFEYGAQYFV